MEHTLVQLSLGKEVHVHAWIDVLERPRWESLLPSNITDWVVLLHLCASAPADAPLHYCHAHANVHACWYCCTHRRSLCVMESIHGLGLNHVWCPPSWTCHVPHRDSYRDPCHWTCGCLYPGNLRTVVSVPNYARGASPTQCYCQRCWNGDPNNCRKEWIPHPSPLSKTALYLPL